MNVIPRYMLPRQSLRAFADARVVRGDRFASVTTGLALFAQRRFARAAKR